MVNSILVFLVTLLLAVPAAARPVTLTITKDVIKRNLIPLGINLSNDAWHTGAILTHERVRNGSFEGVLYRQITHGPRAGRDWYEDSYPAGTWEGILETATPTFLTGPAKGKVQLDTVEQILDKKSGNIVPRYHFKKLRDTPEPFDGLLFETNKSTGWLGQHGGDWWVFTNGDEASVKTVQQPPPPGVLGESIALLDAHSGKAQILCPISNAPYAEVNGEWLLRFWAKGKGYLTISLTDIAHRNDTTDNELSISLHENWSYYEESVTLDNYPHDLLALGFTITDGKAYLDTVSMQKKHADNSIAFRQPLVDTLLSLAPSVLRFHQVGGSSLDNWLAPRDKRKAYSSSRLFPPPSGKWPSHPIENGKAHTHPYSLNDFLKLCKRVGASPWICLPGTLTTSEAANVIAFLAGPVTTTYGMIRAEAGQIAPWTTIFDTIHIEIGNEAWNTTPPYLHGGYSVKGEYWNDLFRQMRSSKWFSSQIRLHAGGQAVNAWLNRRIAQEVPAADTVAIAPYLLHDLNKTTESQLTDEQLLEWVLGASYYFDRQGFMAENTTTVPKPLSVYEVNYHVTGGNASASSKNKIAATSGGTVILADWLVRLIRNHDCSPINLFTLFHPLHKTQTGNIALWGLTLSMKRGHERHRPLFYAATLINRFLHGNMVNVTTDIQESPTPYRTPDGEVITAPRLTAYATQQGKQHRLLIMNLSMSEEITITCSDLPPIVDKTSLTGNSFLSSNEYSYSLSEHDTIHTSSTELVTLNRMKLPSKSISLPPASITLIEWEK